MQHLDVSAEETPTARAFRVPRRVAFLGVLSWTLCGPAAAEAPALTAEIERCAGCHGADARAASLPTAGRIAGQNVEYLQYILRQYRLGRLQGLNGGVMTNAVRHLDDAQLQALARYYAGLP